MVSQLDHMDTNACAVPILNTNLFLKLLVVSPMGLQYFHFYHYELNFKRNSYPFASSNISSNQLPTQASFSLAEHFHSA